MGRGARVAICVAVVCCIAAPAAHAAFPGQNGRIAFTRSLYGGLSTTDVYSVTPSGLGTMRLTSSGKGRYPAWSADSTRIAFVDDGKVVTAAEDGTDREVVLSAPDGDIGEVAWSPAGEKLALSLATCPTGCFHEIYTVSTGGTGLTRLTFEPRNAERPAWSPDGTRILFDSERTNSLRELLTIRPDGTDLVNLTNTLEMSEHSADWLPDGTTISFVRTGQAPDGLHTMPAAGGPAQFRHAILARYAWSPDSTRIAHVVGPGSPLSVRTIDAASGGDAQQVTSPPAGFEDVDVAWQPVPQPPPPQAPLVGPGYPRPKGATPVSVSLVPTYDQCSVPNRTHGPPLAFPSCNPPARSSSTLTVGTPDANGNPVGFSGSVILNVVPGQPGRPEDAAVLLAATFGGVYWNSGCTGSPPPCELEGYIGELEVVAGLRITDRLNDGGAADTEAATTTDAALSLPVTCDGIRCDLMTDINAIVPGLVRERRRAIWELGDIRVRDAGPDGSLATTGDQSTFLRQGIFVP